MTDKKENPEPPVSIPEEELDVEQPEAEQPEAAVLNDLVILPPLQKSGTLDRDENLDAVPLPPIRAEEPISSIRAALSEVVGYAHLTNYRFVLEEPTKSKPAGNVEPPTISPYTGRNAVISVPVAVKSLEKESQREGKEQSLVLDDYGDLTSLADQGLQDGSAFRVVLERYDVALIRDHVTRLRSLLDGNSPSATSLDEGAETREKVASSEQEEKASEEEPNPDDSSKGATKSETPKETAADDKKSKNAEDSKNIPKDLPFYPTGKSVAADSSNLKDFFYLACGEEPTLYSEDAKNFTASKKENGSKSKKKGKKGKDKSTNKDEEENEEPTTEKVMSEIIPRLNALEENTRVKCSIRFSGFHPPPANRRLMGDLTYLEVVPPGETDAIHISAIPTGFYVNRSTSKNGSYNFDPSPAGKPCFSHELLDCLLQCSPSFLVAWNASIEASRTRAELMAKLNEDGPFSSLFRVAIRGDFSGYHRSSTASASEGIDALIQNPSWLVPIPRVEKESEDSWTRNCSHTFNPASTEDDLSSSFGVDIRSGTLRDWNEELQSAREMSVENVQERIERARVMNKVLTDFGEASVLGVKAICDGQIAPMNPNESTRSQVYLHNNIFFSRAVDAGVETFKVAKGDKAARKSASRDVQCLGALHRMERSGLYTLATVLVDYLGTRYVCQSILPGILSGEKTHTLLYGAVEAGSPLTWDKEMHELLENTLGKSLMIASRPLPREPLTEERAAEIEAVKTLSPLYAEKQEGEEKKDEKAALTINVCAPIEAKGIRGNDQRNYVLDMTRLTPRDANWVPQEKGGTGNWESLLSDSKSHSKIPKSLADDEWTLAVLRPELITNYAQIRMTKYLNEKKEKEAQNEQDGDKGSGSESKVQNESDKKKAMESSAVDDSVNQNSSTKAESEKTDKNKEGGEEKKAAKLALAEEDLEYLKSLRFNVNVFLPDIKSMEGIDEAAFEQNKKDEEMARTAAKFLWDEAIPRITHEIREGSGHQIPHDGKGLTEFIHQHGVNCRYFGQLATLAQVEEEKDRKIVADFRQGKSSRLARRSMPRFWLELLECEMVARAAKHVLDRYLTDNGGTAAFSPLQTVSSFLCAMISDGEETAAQTENRMKKRDPSDPDEDDFNTLTLYDAGGAGDAGPAPVRGRYEVWKDIEQEIARRFRYSLTLFNRPGKNDRILYIPLLRRVCQRTGVRLAAKSYEVGGKCLCSGGGSGGQITASHPISPLDIMDVVPLMKHSAAHGEGFVPCGLGPSNGIPALHISLPDARAALEAAHLHHSGRALSRALDLAQEACSLYQRVTENPAHPGVVRCIDLMASILFDAGEPALAAANAVKALGLLVQIGGFDSPDVISAHLMIFQMMVSSGQPSKAVKHLRAAGFLMEILGGPRHVELANAYHKIGTVYHGNSDLVTALRFYQEAASRESCDRLLEGMISKSSAMVLASLGEYKHAVESEKRAYQLFKLLLGDNHQLTKTSDKALNQFMGAAVQHGSRMVEDMKKQKEEEAAQAVANEIQREEEMEQEKRKKKNKKKKGKK